MGKKKKKETITLKIKPKLGRDFVHLAEITHGSGCGAHEDEKPRNNNVNDLHDYGCPYCGILDCYECCLYEGDYIDKEE